MEETTKYAVLIDSDNISPKWIKYILDEVSDDGVATYKRCYGDWTAMNKKGWKDVLLNNSITPIQQYSYTTGKNATDSAMIIDAMDILYTGDVDAFCLVSSDSDFTRLAARLREAGKYVLGIGERKTPQALRSACNAFKLIEVISETENDKTEKTASKGAENVDLTSIEEIQKAVQKILDENGNKGKSTGIGEIGSKLQNKYPDFDVRNYGYSKLTTFIEDGLSGMALIKEGSSFRVQSKASKLTKADVEQQIIEILKKNGGQINNLGSLSRSLKQINPGFSIDSFGYRKMSSFLGSFSSLEIDGNSVRLI
ncbi:MAG: NYN domain-containing protein [Lachnospiraceae bacterium]|nr:NYN domain-containing protein [Lachnospiraceae bacterium]